ncbi:MAG: ABC transporter ATP-binding protein [Eubacteriales bacterium]|nr:ABC transporter ATP-binding protein [Eubacteriales bacterium]
MIRLGHIHKTYQNTEVLHALNDVSLYIPKGEFVAVTGPSGSGKSTLMNIVGCLDLPTSGTYLLDGHPIDQCSSDELAGLRSRKIGFIFQGFNLLSQYDALENVEMPLLYWGIPKALRRARAQEALQAVGLEKRLHHTPSQLSGGQQQRVAIARALVTQPQLILADEPTGNLDSASGQEVMCLLQELHRMGNTIMLITHDAAIAAQAQRIIVIRDGCITSDTKA